MKYVRSNRKNGTQHEKLLFGRPILCALLCQPDGGFGTIFQDRRRLM